LKKDAADIFLYAPFAEMTRRRKSWRKERPKEKKNSINDEIALQKKNSKS